MTHDEPIYKAQLDVLGNLREHKEQLNADLNKTTKEKWPRLDTSVTNCGYSTARTREFVIYHLFVNFDFQNVQQKTDTEDERATREEKKCLTEKADLRRLNTPPLPASGASPCPSQRRLI